MSGPRTCRHKHLLVSQAILCLFVASVWPFAEGAQNWLPNRVGPSLISDPADYYPPLGFDESVASSWSPETQALSRAVDKNKCGLAPLNKLSGRTNIEPYINRGDAVKSGEFPSFVMLDITFKNGAQTGGFGCGGTLISDRHVLTAAHCFQSLQEYKTVSVKATLGGFHRDWYREPAASAVADKKCMGIEQYGYESQNHSNDWAILTLTKPVKFNNYVQPACLPPIDVSSNMQPLTSGFKSQCYLVGVGAISAKLIRPQYPTSSSAQRPFYEYFYPYREVQKLRVEEVDCGSYMIDKNDVSRTCYISHSARPSPGGPCVGDSGGPVLCKNPQGRWTVMAADSYGPSHCNYEKPEIDVFTDTRKMQLNPAYKGCLSKSSMGRSAPRHHGQFKSRVYFAQPDDLDMR